MTQQKTILYFVITIAACVVLFSLPIHAQTTTQLLLTWRATNSAPPTYQGKIIPIPGTPVEVAAALIDKNRFVDLSRYTIRWLVNDAPLREGRGITSVAFSADPLYGFQRVSAEILDYSNASLKKTIDIPTTSPYIILAPPRPDNEIVAGGNTFKILAYFFNITSLKDLEFAWRLNSELATPEGDDLGALTLNAAGSPAGTQVNLALDIKNLRNPNEAAKIQKIFHVE